MNEFEEISKEERHKRYLAYLGIDEETYQELFKELGINVQDPFPAICFSPIQDKLSADKDVKLDLDTVRKMGMLIDPYFLLELRVNGIVPEFVFRLAKKGEVPERFLRSEF